MLTSLETLNINKKMQENFKFEKEDNINILNNSECKKEIIRNNKNSELYDIKMKCYDGFNKIKTNPNLKNLYFSNISDRSSLSLIEKKIINLKNKSIDDFISDLRK